MTLETNFSENVAARFLADAERSQFPFMMTTPRNSCSQPAYSFPLPGPAVAESASALLLPDAERCDVQTGLWKDSVYDFEQRNSTICRYRDDYTPKTPKASHGYVYAATYEGQPGLVKIGQSKHYPTGRMAGLTSQTAAPSSLKLLFALETPFRRAAESSAHHTLKSRRSKGEWFHLSPADLQSVMFGLATIHEWRKYGWRLWVMPEFLGMCDAEVIRNLCLAGMGAAPTACELEAPAKPALRLVGRN